MKRLLTAGIAVACFAAGALIAPPARACPARSCCGPYLFEGFPVEFCPADATYTGYTTGRDAGTACSCVCPADAGHCGCGVLVNFVFPGATVLPVCPTGTSPGHYQAGPFASDCVCLEADGGMAGNPFASGSGGASGTGGTPNASAGRSGAGGGTSSGGTSSDSGTADAALAASDTSKIASTTTDKSGCGCSVPSRPTHAGVVAVVGLALLALRRRGRPS